MENEVIGQAAWNALAVLRIECLGGKAPTASVRGVYETVQQQCALIHLSSPHSVAETTKRLEAALQRGIALFCHIDHSAEAEKVGMKCIPHNY